MNKFAVILALVSGTSAVQWNRWTQYRMNLAEVRAKEASQKYSDELANGSEEDDREMESDEEYWNVDDVGFQNLWKGHFGFAQIGYQQQIAYLQRQHAMSEANALMQDLPSNEVANGDKSEDKQLEDQDDANDDIVDNNGFVNQFKRHGDIAQVRSRDDWNNDIGTYEHQKTRNYATPYRTSENFSPFWDENHIMAGSHITIPRDEFKIMRNSALSQVRAGDDWNNDIGTYEHQKTRNYATPYGTSGNFAPFVAENHILPGSHITVPRDEGPMRNSLNVKKHMTKTALTQSRDDWNNDIGTYEHQKTRNYATPYGTSGNFAPFVAENHIMPGSHITVPRDEGPMRNSLNVKKHI